MSVRMLLLSKEPGGWVAVERNEKEKKQQIKNRNQPRREKMIRAEGILNKY